MPTDLCAQSRRFVADTHLCQLVRPVKTTLPGRWTDHCGPPVCWIQFCVCGWGEVTQRQHHLKEKALPAKEHSAFLVVRSVHKDQNPFACRSAEVQRHSEVFHLKVQQIFPVEGEGFNSGLTALSAQRNVQQKEIV